MVFERPSIHRSYTNGYKRYLDDELHFDCDITDACVHTLKVFNQIWENCESVSLI